MTYRYVIDIYGAIWAQWLYTRENYKTVLPGRYHADAENTMRYRTARRPFFLQVNMSA